MAAVPRADISYAAERLTHRNTNTGRELKKLPDHLLPSERVQRIVFGRTSGAKGLVVETNQRLLFLRDGFSNKIVHPYPYSSITSIQWRQQAGMNLVDLIFSGTKVQIQVYDSAAGVAMVESVRARIAKSAAGAAAQSGHGRPVAAEGVDVMDQLKKLGELRDSGIVTAVEFEAKKTDLLRRL